jgi:hypothetical protein
MRLRRFLKQTILDLKSSFLSDVFELSEQEPLTVTLDVTVNEPSNTLQATAFPSGNTRVPLF